MKTRSVSRTVEYAYDDFCVAQLASGLGGDAATYLNRSGNWANVFKADQRSDVQAGQDSGFAGFVQPRFANGTYGYQDPTLCSPMNDFTGCYLIDSGHETYEGSSWLYTFYAPHDMAALIAALGGADEFVRRLQYLHDTAGLLYFGDEQAFLLVFLFHYAGRPGLSARQAHAYIPAQFNDSTVGIPGNDDSGAMGSFSTLAMMGLWPVAGQDVYLISSPFFPELSVTNGLTGKTATVRAVGLEVDGQGAYANVYVQRATRDGQPWTKNWIDHAFFRDGGVLELTLGKDESDWGTADADLPPSMSTGRQG